MLKGLINGVVTCLLALACGCGKLEGQLKPDRVSVGTAVRQIRGGKNGFSIDTAIPVGQIRVKEKVNESTDVFFQIQGVGGSVDAEHPINALTGQAKGWLFGLGGGIDYYPWITRAFGLELGAEYLRTEYDMRGGVKPFEQVEMGKVDAAGFFGGFTGEIPVDKKGRFQIVYGLGPSIGIANARSGSADFGGWYSSLSLQVNFGEKPKSKRKR